MGTHAARPRPKGRRVVWSPLGWGRLTGKIRRGQPIPEVSAACTKPADIGPQVDDEYLYKVVDAIDEVAKETGKTVPQIALNWLLQRPTVSNVVIGARNEQQLRQTSAPSAGNSPPTKSPNSTRPAQLPSPYPYWHQRLFRPKSASDIPLLR